MPFLQDDQKQRVNYMRFPSLSDESLIVNNFLAIETCQVSLKDIGALIGPQAAGKSIIAKLFYFFRSYLRDTFFEFVPSIDDRRVFNKSKADEFYELFVGSDDEAYSFKIEYYFGEHFVSVVKAK